MQSLTYKRLSFFGSFQQNANRIVFTFLASIRAVEVDDDGVKFLFRNTIESYRWDEVKSFTIWYSKRAFAGGGAAVMPLTTRRVELSTQYKSYSLDLTFKMSEYEDPSELYKILATKLQAVTETKYKLPIWYRYRGLSNLMISSPLVTMLALAPFIGLNSAGLVGLILVFIAAFVSDRRLVVSKEVFNSHQLSSSKRTTRRFYSWLTAILPWYIGILFIIVFFFMFIYS